MWGVDCRGAPPCLAGLRKFLSHFSFDPKAFFIMRVIDINVNIYQTKESKLNEIITHWNESLNNKIVSIAIHSVSNYASPLFYLFS